MADNALPAPPAAPAVAAPPPGRPGGAQLRTVAAIDVGSNALRMVIAELDDQGRVEVLERLQRTARLGQDTFRRGRLGGAAMRTAIAILRDFKRMLDFYRVGTVRAVATSAVREAANVDLFLDRAYVATGIDLEVIDTSEEIRLDLGALRPALADVADLQRSRGMVLDVGGGSALLTLLERGELVSTQSLQLGSVRLLETASAVNEPAERTAELWQRQIANVVASVSKALPLGKVRVLVVSGGDARFAGRLIGEATGSPHLQAIGRADFARLLAELQPLTPDELARAHGLPLADAETVVPALLVYHAFWQATRAPRLLVSQITMRDGLLLDLARPGEDEAVVQGIVHAARAVAAKYDAEPNHAEFVADTAVRLFDELRSEHALGNRERLLLHVAGILHEVGGFVSNRAHHKHSYYLIANAELFGVTREETQIIAHVARYHRRGVPRSSHPEYMSLPRDTRMVVSKLAALLRVADAFDRSHNQQLRQLTFERSNEELIIYAHTLADLTLERRALKSKGDLFEDIYGLKVRLEEAPLGASASPVAS